MGRGRKRESWGFAEGDEIVPGRIALENLGGGWDFEVFLVWDEHLYSLVVAKVVRPNLVADEHTLRSLAREAGLLERLAHPVIVRGFGAMLGGDRPHLLLEHLEGVALAAAIKSTGRLDLHQLVPLAYQLASALQYLANEHVVHLDVKPDNVILGVPPRLVDLSIARPVEDAARVRSPIGTDAFMAPEQCDPATGTVGTPADVWGLGATLYQAVAGALPYPRSKDFDRDDPGQRFPQLSGVPAPPLSDAPGPLAEVVADCLAFEASARPAAGDVASRLEPLIEVMRPGRILGRERPRLR